MVLLSTIKQPERGTTAKMNAHLSTILTLTASRAESDVAADEDGFEAGTLEARLAEALLGDALLTERDLPATWYEANPGASMIAGTDYEALALGYARRAFGEPRSGRRIEQQLAVLPRWTARDMTIDPLQPHVGAVPPDSTDRTRGVLVLERPAVADDTAEVVQYGTVVLALRYEDPRGGEMPASLRETAHARCRELAHTLR